MSELWIPGLTVNPVEEELNVFDLMLWYQEQLNALPDPDDTLAWHPIAMGALYALSRVLKSMTFEERQIGVATELAWVKSLEEPGKQWEVENVGLRGSLYDVDCIKRGSGYVPEISLAMNVESFFTIADPNDSDLLLTSASAPIGHVHYIEPEAA